MLPTRKPAKIVPRRAITLTELLVVIGIIALLAGLLLPAVLGAREVARRATCSNNLAHIGKAIQTYEAANGHFPPGAYGATAYSWIAMILPQLDQLATYEKLVGFRDKKMLWGSWGQTPGSRNDMEQLVYTTELSNFYLPTLVCPTSPLPRSTPFAASGAVRMNSSYIAAAGATDRAFKPSASIGAQALFITNPWDPRPDRCPQAISDGMMYQSAHACFNGIMASPYRDGTRSMSGWPPVANFPDTLWWWFSGRQDEARLTGCRASQVLDGLSNCMLVGEQSDWGFLIPDPAAPPVRGPCHSGLKGALAGKTQPPSGRAYNLTAINRPLGTKWCWNAFLSTGGGGEIYTNHDNEIGFFSAHGPGASVVFGDGAVRWLDETIDFNLYQRLAIRDTVNAGPTLPNGSANVKTLP